LASPPSDGLPKLLRELVERLAAVENAVLDLPDKLAHARAARH
jgi:hypothetical protein